MLTNRTETASVHAAAQDSDAPLDAQTPAQSLEEQLAAIIVVARGVAVAAEELLREIAQTGTADRGTQHAISMAPRLLAATEQQLASVSAMLRKG